MYCSHFNLKKKPFQLSTDNSFLWLGDTHARALGLLRHGIDSAQRLLVLTGDIGTGKTTLIHELSHFLPQTTAVAHITDPSIERHHLLLSIARDLGFGAFYEEGEEFDSVLSVFLSRRSPEGKCLIIIDEAHLMSERFLSQIPAWAKSAPDNTLTFILAGQLEFHQVLEETLGRSWQAQVDVHAMLSPLDEQQTLDYINRRLELAGATAPIFIPETVREVHRYTKGIPRRINIACDQAMIAAFSKDMHTVDARTFREAVGILELPRVPAVVAPPVPDLQMPSLFQRVRRQATTVLPVLAAAVLLVVVAYTFHSRTFPVSTPAATAAHGQPPGTIVPKEVSQTEPESHASVKTPTSPVKPDPVPLVSPEQIPGKSKKAADMDAFVEEVFMMHKADIMAQAPDVSPRPTAHGAPAHEKPEPAPAVPSASGGQDSESVHESVGSSSVQPEPDAVIDWLIREKSR
nr:AAA family ATPase [uncultured Desulfobacter sp.]